MRKWLLTAFFGASTLLFSCNSEEKLNGTLTIDSGFSTTTSGWMGGFSDYEAATPTPSLALRYDRARLPAALDSNQYGLRIESRNLSNTMFSFIKKKVTGLRPGSTYDVKFDLTIGTQYSDNGSVPSSANDTYLKAGATSKEPVVKVDGGKYRININKGDLSDDGTEMLILGNISNGLDSNAYRLVNRSTENKAISVTANPDGEIWLCIGTDSGYKGLTTLYYKQLKTTLTLAN
jgi:hypothetical protein